jgi:histidine triad (HIT) family protein
MTFSPELCPFCRIVRGETDAEKVYESPTVVAFFPDEPVTLGHTLVVPCSHISDLLAADDALANDVFTVARHLSASIKRALSAEGLNVINSVGAVASQTVFHLHVHLVPRWAGDALGDFWPASPPWSEEEKERAARLIRSAQRQSL